MGAWMDDGWMMVDGRMDGCMDGGMDERMDGRMDGWQDGWIDGFIYTHNNIHLINKCTY